LSPALLNVHINGICSNGIEKLAQYIITYSLKITRYVCQTQVDDLQRSLYTLHNSAERFGTEIPPLKSKVVVFIGYIPMRRKIVRYNTTLEHVDTFTYFGCKISFEKEKGIISKLIKFVQKF